MKNRKVRCIQIWEQLFYQKTGKIFRVIIKYFLPIQFPVLNSRWALLQSHLSGRASPVKIAIFHCKFVKVCPRTPRNTFFQYIKRTVADFRFIHEKTMDYKAFFRFLRNYYTLGSTWKTPPPTSYRFSFRKHKFAQPTSLKSLRRRL